MWVVLGQEGVERVEMRCCLQLLLLLLLLLMLMLLLLLQYLLVGEQLQKIGWVAACHRRWRGRLASSSWRTPALSPCF